MEFLFDTLRSDILIRLRHQTYMNLLSIGLTIRIIGAPFMRAIGIM